MNSSALPHSPLDKTSRLVGFESRTGPIRRPAVLKISLLVYDVQLQHSLRMMIIDNTGIEHCITRIYPLTRGGEETVGRPARGEIISLQPI